MSTKIIGNVTTAKVLARLTELRKQVLIPFGDAGDYDLALDEGNTIARLQCKTGRFKNGVIIFPTDSCGTKSNGATYTHGYKGKVEYFAVWCEKTDAVYMVPIADAPDSRCFLRVDPPKRKTKLTKMADTYKI